MVTQIATSIPTQPQVEPTQVPTQTPLTYPTLAVQYNGTIINTTSTPMPASLTLAAIMQAGANIALRSFYDQYLKKSLLWNEFSGGMKRHT